MKLKVQVVVEEEEGSTTPIIVEEVACFERKEELMENLGLRLEEAKQILATVQKKLVQTQVKNYLTNHRQCSHCHKALKGKDSQSLTFRTLFGKFKLDSPRFYSCKCQPSTKKSFSPLTGLFSERTAPEFSYLQTKWAALMSYGMTADLLAEVLPLDKAVSTAVLSGRVKQIAERLESELGEERVFFIDGCQLEWEALPLPDAPLTIGIDGGYVQGRAVQVREIRWQHSENELDVTSDVSVEQATRHVIEQAGRLDVVINNTGLAANGPLETFSPAQIQQLFETNVFGIIRVNRAVLPQMRKQQSGLLVQISSVAGRQAFPFIGLYSATKFAVEALSEASRQELAALGIDVVVVEPDAYATNILANGIVAADNARTVPYADFMAQVAGFVQAAIQDSNPQEVADAIATLLATPAGQRPLRLIVAPEGRYAGLEAINSLSAEISAGTAAALGWEAFTTLASAPLLASAGVTD